MTEAVTVLLKSSKLGLSGIFLALYLMMFYALQDANDKHSKEYKELSHRMIEALEHNAKNSAELSKLIEHVLRSK